MPLGMVIGLGQVTLCKIEPAPPPAKGAQQPPLLGPCLLWPRSPISAATELLLVIDAVLQIKQSIHQVLVHHARKYTVLYNLGQPKKM